MNNKTLKKSPVGSSYAITHQVIIYQMVISQDIWSDPWDKILQNYLIWQEFVFEFEQVTAMNKMFGKK